MKENLKIIYVMGKGNIYTQMEPFIRADGRMVSLKNLELLI